MSETDGQLIGKFGKDFAARKEKGEKP